MIEKLKKYTILLFIFILIYRVEVYSQNTKDTVIVVDNYSRYIGLTCMLREEFIKSVKNGDALTIGKYRNATIIFPVSEEQTIKSRLLTVRENQMLQFYNGEYDKLLSDLKTGEDYFLSSNKVEKGYDYPNFDCGNLTLAVLDFWKSQSDNIIAKIKQSTLTTPEKELLSLYWKAIVLFIENEKTLSPDINKKAVEYFEKYPDSQYKSFLERLSGIKRFYQANGMTLGFGLGKSYPNGAIDKYLKGDFTFNFEVGYTFKNWNLSLGYRLHGFNYQDSLRLVRLDTLNLNQSSSIEYDGVGLKIGYTVFDKGWVKFQPFISGELNSLVNTIDIPDSTVVSQRGKTHPMFGFGTEGSIRLTKNLIKINHVDNFYYPREEKDLPYNPVFLNFRIGYYPNVFNKPTNISGDIFYFTIGLEWTVGRNQVNYRYKK